jgi:microcystin-dependent protein
MKPFAGQLALFPYGFTPSGWKECAGQFLSMSQYPGLYAVIGTTYGVIDDNFGLPDLRGRAPVGQGAQPGGGTYAFAQTGGVELANMDQSMMQAHTHDMMALSGDGTTNDPTNALLAAVAGDTPKGRALGKIYNPAWPDGQLQGLQGAGNQQPHNNMQPSLTLRYCINFDGPPPPRP